MTADNRPSGRARVRKAAWRRWLAMGGIAATAVLLHAAQNPPSGARVVLTGGDAFSDWSSDRPGVRRRITVADLPRPYASSSGQSFAAAIAQPQGAWPQVPAGFKIERLAMGLRNPRLIRTAPNGDFFIADSESGRILLLRVASGPVATPQAPSVFASGLDLPFGIAFYPPGPEPRYVYIANTGSVIRFPYRNGDLQARGKPEVLVSNIPGYGRLAGGGHWTRDIAFSKDGAKMFVSVGSRSNVSDNDSEKRRANVLEFNPDGSGERIYASGIRNPVSLAVNPSTGVLWTSVNERDELGDNLPPDYITHLTEGGFYGWPWYYLGPNQDPRHAGKHPELRSKVLVPDVLVQAHSASLGMTFYSGQQFPAEYQGDAFAAEHGSWNRVRRTGYKIIRVPMKDGKATGEYEDFVTGFVTSEGRVWGRPVGVTMAVDGSLVFTEDSGGSVWRVRYVGNAK